MGPGCQWPRVLSHVSPNIFFLHVERAFKVIIFYGGGGGGGWGGELGLCLDLIFPEEG